MLSYDECKEKAVSKAEEYGAVIDKAYSIGDAYVFDDSEHECVGVLPLVVDPSTGNTEGIWNYINRNNMTMDDMVEREL